VSPILKTKFNSIAGLLICFLASCHPTVSGDVTETKLSSVVVPQDDEPSDLFEGQEWEQWLGAPIQTNVTFYLPKSKKCDSTGIVLAPLVLLIHGFMGDHHSHSELARWLAAAGFVVVVPQLGSSLWPTPLDETVAQNVRDFLQNTHWNDWPLPEETKRNLQLNSQPLAMVGYSAGGLVAIHLASQESSLPPAALVLLDPVPTSDKPESLRDITSALFRIEAPLLTMQAEVKNACNRQGIWSAMVRSMDNVKATTTIVLKSLTHCDLLYPAQSSCVAACGPYVDDDRRRQRHEPVLRYTLAWLSTHMSGASARLREWSHHILQEASMDPVVVMPPHLTIHFRPHHHAPRSIGRATPPRKRNANRYGYRKRIVNAIERDTKHVVTTLQQLGRQTESLAAGAKHQVMGKLLHVIQTTAGGFSFEGPDGATFHITKKCLLVVEANDVLQPMHAHTRLFVIRSRTNQQNLFHEKAVANANDSTNGEGVSGGHHGQRKTTAQRRQSITDFFTRGFKRWVKGHGSVPFLYPHTPNHGTTMPMTKRVFNFNPGPGALPLPALEQAQKDILDVDGTGMSILEHSHRGRCYERIHNEAIELLTELLAIPSSHQVLFLQGGARQQFAMVPMNFLHPGQTADYLVTGLWGEGAVKEAGYVGQARVAATSAHEGTYQRVVRPDEYTVSPDAAYVHYTTNETVHGVQFHQPVNSGNVPLVADISSDFLSRPLALQPYSLVYAGAQKNAGPSGVTIVIVQKDWLEKGRNDIPAIFRYSVHAGSNSLYNTAPTFAIYMVRNVLRWLKAEGGLTHRAEENRSKAAMIYDLLDRHADFYQAPVERESRSWMNIVFRLPNETLETQFLEAASARNMVGLKGHRAVGGIRASIYNAVSREAVTALAALLEEFAQRPRLPHSEIGRL